MLYYPIRQRNFSNIYMPPFKITKGNITDKAHPDPYRGTECSCHSDPATPPAFCFDLPRCRLLLSRLLVHVPTPHPSSAILHMPHDRRPPIDLQCTINRTPLAGHRRPPEQAESLPGLSSSWFARHPLRLSTQDAPPLPPTSCQARA